MTRSGAAEQRLKNRWLKNKKRLLSQLRAEQQLVLAEWQEVFQHDSTPDRR